MALLVLGSVFVFFLAIALAVAGLAGNRSLFAIGDRIGVIEVSGAIDSSKKIIEQILDFKTDSTIKAIVLRIDSPGGGVGPSQEIHEEVQKLAEVKPVVVSMGSVAASGGYYIAVPAKLIMANPGTITGSIGVIMEFATVQELMQKIGLQSQVIKSGAHKDIGSPFRPLSPADRALLQAMIDDVHSQFITAVSEGRKMKAEQVAALADGRIFSGRQAREAGLVDELGNLQDAIEAAAELAGLPGEPKVIYPAPEKRPLLDYFVEETASRFVRGLRGQTTGLRFLWSGVE